MKYEDLFDDAFVKQFETGGAKFTDFLKEIQKCGIEKILEGKLNCHLYYLKHQNSSDSNFFFENILKLHSLTMVRLSIEKYN